MEDKSAEVSRDVKTNADCSRNGHALEAIEGNYVCVNCGDVSTALVLATDFNTAADLAVLRRTSPDNPVALFNKLNGLSSKSNYVVPRALFKAQKLATHRCDYVERFKAALKKDVTVLVRRLCRRLGQWSLQGPVRGLAYTYLCSLVRERIQAKADRVTQKLQSLRDITDRCCVCRKLPPEGQRWIFHPRTCRDGILCDECNADGWDCCEQGHRVQCNEQNQRHWIAKYADRLPAISLARTSIVGACLYIEAERNHYRFRFGEICTALAQLGKPIKKETLKKWVSRVRRAAGIPALSLADRITGYACRLLQQHYSHTSEEAATEEEQRDLQLMVNGLMHADRKRPTQTDKKRTVQCIDGLLQECLLDSRLHPPSPITGTAKSLGGRSERLVAAVIVYLRLRLRGDKQDRSAILNHCKAAGVDLQSFQACKADLIRLIDPSLWK